MNITQALEILATQMEDRGGELTDNEMRAVKAAATRAASASA